MCPNKACGFKSRPGHRRGSRIARHTVKLTRCPRCFAEDISADAHPSRRIVDGVPAAFFVCRNCFRPAELEYRIACENATVPYAPLSIRESLQLLRSFYLERRAEAQDDPRVELALREVERRLLIAAVPPGS
jgi:hypothetical protein